MTIKNFDAFVSYSRIDQEVVLRVADALRARGLRLWIDIFEIAPGMVWTHEIVRAMEHCNAVLIMLGASGQGSYSDVELLSILRNEKRPIIPVLIPGAPSDVRLPLSLAVLTYIDLRLGVTAEGIDQIYWGITGKRPGSRVSQISTPPLETVRSRATVNDVFQTVGLPEYTYVEPRIYRSVANAIRQSGKHVIVEGSSGTGKSCMVFRILREFRFENGREYRYFSAAAEQTAESLAEILDRQDRSEEHREARLVVIDDLHYLPPELRQRLAKYLKSLSDQVFTNAAPVKFILIGIPAAASGLIFNVHDLGPRIGSFRMPTGTGRQLLKLIRDGEARLRVEFSRPDEIIAEANGSFYICQYLCHEICALNGIDQTGDDVAVLSYRIEEVREMLMEDLGNRFHAPLVACLKRSAEGGADLHALISMLRVLSTTPKSALNMGEMVARARGDGKGIRLAKNSMHQFIHNPGGNQTLSRLLHYDDETEIFTVEDPMFGYYLRHVDLHMVAEASGILNFNEVMDVPAVAVDPGETVAAELSTSILASTALERDQVFISYSHKDTFWLEKLQTMLKPLVRQKLISAWSDTQIQAGDHWHEDIQRALRVAKVAVLLVSPDFLASDFIAQHELQPLLTAAEEEGLTIIWIPVRPSMYKYTEIELYQAASDPAMPLSSLPDWQQEIELVGICEQITKAALN
jgi:TIR domain